MSKIGAVHFNPKFQPYLKHNDRTCLRAKNIHKDLIRLNEYDKSSSQAMQEIDNLYNEAMQKLSEAKRKGKRTPKERSYHEAIFEINENTTMAQCQELADKIAELTGFTRIQVSIHRDEGHTDDNGQWKPHYHAHAVFFTLDRTTGKQLARLEASLNPRTLSKIQDTASQVLQMQRGKCYFDNEKYQAFLDSKSSKSQTDRISYTPQSPKRIQNQDDFKRFKDEERRLKKELEKERERELKQESRIRHFLNSQNEDLMQKLAESKKREQDKDKTIDSLNKNFKTATETIENHNQGENQRLNYCDDLLEIDTKKMSLQEANKAHIAKIQTIKQENTELKEQKEAIERNRDELAIKNTELEGKAESYELRIKTLEREKGEEIEKHKEEIDKLLARVKELETENQNLKDKISVSSNKNSDLTNENEKVIPTQHQSQEIDLKADSEPKNECDEAILNEFCTSTEELNRWWEAKQRQRAKQQESFMQETEPQENHTQEAETDLQQRNIRRR